jgi:hypothetical protein
LCQLLLLVQLLVLVLLQLLLLLLLIKLSSVPGTNADGTNLCRLDEHPHNGLHMHVTKPSYLTKNPNL